MLLLYITDLRTLPILDQYYDFFFIFLTASRQDYHSHSFGEKILKWNITLMKNKKEKLLKNGRAIKWLTNKGEQITIQHLAYLMVSHIQSDLRLFRDQD